MPETTESDVVTRRLPVAGVVALGLLAVAAALLGVALSGAVDASGLGDPGAVVRWGLPVVTVGSEIAASVALGGALLGAFVLPRGAGRTPSDGRAWPAAMLVSAVAAGVWTVLSVADVVLSYASVAGRPVAGPTFGTELGLFVTSVSLGRTLLGVAVVAAVACVAALLASRPVGALLAALLVGVALAMQSQTGHAAGDTSHDLAISSMFLHLAGAAVWIGALAALALVAHRLGRDLAPAVARYSVVAAWAFVAVAVSGTVNAALRLGGPDTLLTPYGLLVVAKVVLFVALGGLGWLHRRRTIPALVTDAAGPRPTPWPFWRLVAVQLAVMGAVSGVAVALGSTAPPTPTAAAAGDLTAAERVTGHPLPPSPTTELWLTSFRWDLLPALACLAAAVVYVRWVLRLRARGDAWPPLRTISVLTGLAVLAWTTSGGPAVYGHVLFSAHMIQHMVLAMVVPILLALSAPVTLASRALPVRTDGSWGPREWLLGLVHSRWAQVLAHPVVAAVVFAGSMIVFYFTGLFELALTTYAGHLGMILHFTLAGYLFVNALVGVDPGPTRLGYPLRLLLLFATMAFHAFFGVSLTSGETLLVPDWFGLLGRPWGPSAIADQQAGGAIAWGIGEIPVLLLAIGLALSWARDDERTARRRDRAAERDGDAELTEYNAMLERLGRSDQGERQGGRQGVG